MGEVGGGGVGLWELLTCTPYQISHTHTHTHTHTCARSYLRGAVAISYCWAHSLKIEKFTYQKRSHNQIGLNYTFVNTKLLLKMCYNSSHSILGSVNPMMLPQCSVLCATQRLKCPFFGSIKLGVSSQSRSNCVCTYPNLCYNT